MIISNNTNIKSFNTFEINYFDTKYISSNYPRGETLSVKFLPFETPTLITMFSLHLTSKHLNKDFSIQNFLFPYFYDIENYQKDITVLNPIDDEVNIEGPFFMYIYPNENTFVDILINEIDNNEIIDFNDDDNVLKFLKNGVKYSFLCITENIIRLEINQELTKNIKIIDLDENVKVTLNRDNPYIDLNETYNDFKIISEEDTYINIYHNISNVFPNEEINTIELKKEEIEKGIIINITNIESIRRFNFTWFMVTKIWFLQIYKHYFLLINIYILITNLKNLIIWMKIRTYISIYLEQALIIQFIILIFISWILLIFLQR